MECNEGSHDALSGSEYVPGGLESENPDKDEALRQKILESLEAHVELDASDVKVAVKNGFVSLYGTTKNDNDKATIEALVESQNGVRDLASALIIEEISDLARSLSGQDDFIIQGPL